MTGTRRWVLTAALFAGALVFLVLAILTHSAVLLFVMWVPLLTVPLVLGGAYPGLRQQRADDPAEANPDAHSGTTETNQD